MQNLNLIFIMHLLMNGKSGIIKKQISEKHGKYQKSDRSVSMGNAFNKY